MDKKEVLERLGRLRKTYRDKAEHERIYANSCIDPTLFRTFAEDDAAFVEALDEAIRSVKGCDRGKERLR